jgi:hypothetical protein
MDGVCEILQTLSGFLIGAILSTASRGLRQEGLQIVPTLSALF